MRKPLPGEGGRGGAAPIYGQYRHVPRVRVFVFAVCISHCLDSLNAVPFSGFGFKKVLDVRAKDKRSIRPYSAMTTNFLGWSLVHLIWSPQLFKISDISNLQSQTGESLRKNQC